jgi:hypothetical protein
MMNKLTRALRAKFKSPRDAIRALGLDEKLLDVPRLGLDMKMTRDEPESEREMAWAKIAEHLKDKGALQDAARLFKDEPDDGRLLVELDHLLAEHLDSRTLAELQGVLGHHLGGRAAEDEDREGLDEATAQVESYLRDHSDLTDDDYDLLRPLLRDHLARGRDELPRNALERSGDRSDSDRSARDGLLHRPGLGMGQDGRSAAFFFPELVRIRTDLGGYDLAPIIPAPRHSQAADRRNEPLAHDLAAAFGVSRIADAGGTGC